MGAAQANTNKVLLREQTELAAIRGVFDAPTFFVGEEMFCGNDRLEEALEYYGAMHMKPTDYAILMARYNRWLRKKSR